VPSNGRPIPLFENGGQFQPDLDTTQLTLYTAVKQRAKKDNHVDKVIEPAKQERTHSFVLAPE
jgi:hypothetical protein